MNWNDMVDRVLYVSPNEDATAVQQLLYEAEMEMCDRGLALKEIDTTLTFTDGEMSIPNTFVKMISLKVSQRKLDPILIKDIYYDENNELVSGEPTGYVVTSSKIILNKKKSSGAHMTFYARPSTLDQLSSTKPSIPAKFHLQLIDYVLSILPSNIQDRYYAKWEKALYDASFENSEKVGKQRKPNGNDIEI